MANQPFPLSTPPPASAEGDYEAICVVLRQTERGRRFLEECARQIQNGASRPASGAAELNQKGMDTPEVTADVSTSAERLQDLAWTMRERGLDPAVCEQIEGLASAILTAPSLRGADTYRAQKLSEIVGHLERRIEAMIELARETAKTTRVSEAPPETEPGEFLLQPRTHPAPPDISAGGTMQAAPEELFEGVDEELFAPPPPSAVKSATASAPSPKLPIPPPSSAHGDPLAALNALSDEEKIALFT